MSNTTATKSAAATAAKVEEAKTEYIKPAGHNPDKDWSYLADKDPSEVNTLMAKMATRLSGVEISPKQVQVLLAMHRWMQASDLNREREGFRGRTWEEVRKGNVTLLERAENIITLKGEDAPVVENVNQSGLSAEEILADPEAPLELKEQAAAEVVVADEAKEAKEEAKPAARKPRAPRKTAAQKKAEEAVSAE